MASPEVAGVAALLLNVFPFATAVELKDAMMTTTTQYKTLTVDRPGDAEPVAFSSLSVSGGVVNAYNSMNRLSQQNLH